MAYKISPDLCVACGTCIDECPVEAISAGDVYVIDPDKCIDCGTCAGVCPSEAIQARIILQEGIKKLFPRKEELFYCLFPNGSADTPETRGRSTHTACRPVRDSQQFSSLFQRQITIPPTVNSIRPEAPSKGISRKDRNTSDGSGAVAGHRKTRVQGFFRKRTFPFAESIYYT